MHRGFSTQVDTWPSGLRADESGERRGMASVTSGGPCGRPCSSGRVPAGLPHGRLDSHRDTLSSSALPPALPGRADPTANYENEKSSSRPQMSIFFWHFDSPVISAWSPKNLRNVALIMKIGTWPRGAHVLIGTDASTSPAGPPLLGRGTYRNWLSPLGAGPVSTSLHPAARLQHRLLRKAGILMNVWLPVQKNKSKRTRPPTEQLLADSIIIPISQVKAARPDHLPQGSELEWSWWDWNSGGPRQSWHSSH